MNGVRRRSLAAFAFAAAAALPGVSQAQVFDLASLMAKLAAVRSGRARFTERKTVSALDRPIESAGELAFEAPDRFSRKTLTPRVESVEVAGDQLVLTSGGRTRRAALATLPEAAAIVDAMRGTLTGDRARLERVFTVRLTGNQRQWWLDLVPRDARLSAAVLTIRIAGSEAAIRSVDVFGPDNDRSTTTIEPIG